MKAQCDVLRREPAPASSCQSRHGLYKAWSALANLADLAGELSPAVRAECKNGFDQTKLQNGVLEPLREADLIE